MNTLYVAWQDPATHSWAPVARLTRENGLYRFSYTQGARRFGGFVPFGRMTDLNAEYVSPELFPLFANRILARSRPEYREYLGWLGLEESAYDEFDELARTGGLRATDTLELIPCPTPTDANQYEVVFFVRGLSHLPEDSGTRTDQLTTGERLFLARDIQNEYDPDALLLRTGDPVALLGYVPRYYSTEFSRLMDLLSQAEVRVSVEKVNSGAPFHYRLLCRLSAPWPAEFRPCSQGPFQQISSGDGGSEAPIAA